MPQLWSLISDSWGLTQPLSSFLGWGSCLILAILLPGLRSPWTQVTSQSIKPLGLGQFFQGWLHLCPDACGLLPHGFLCQNPAHPPAGPPITLFSFFGSPVLSSSLDEKLSHGTTILWVPSSKIRPISCSTPPSLTLSHPHGRHPARSQDHLLCNTF